MWQPNTEPALRIVIALTVLTGISSPQLAASSPALGAPLGAELELSSGVAPANAAVALIGTVSAGLPNRSAFSKKVVPLKDAGVWAYRVTDLSMYKARTDQLGGFSFSGLPTGIYKVIAHKSGFLPAVVLVTRTTASALQVLQLELFPDRSGSFSGTTEASADFWEIRKRIPADVLREIQIATLQDPNRTLDTRYTASSASAFTAKMHALTGSGRFANGSDATLVGGNIDLAGQLGDINLGIVGNFRSLHTPQAATLGKAQSVALRLGHSNNGTFDISSRLDSVDTGSEPIDLQRYRVGWNGDVGAGHTAFAANYTNEANYYRDPRNDHFGVPTASRTLDLEGSYTQRFGERGGIETGLRYRERMPLQTTIDRSLTAKDLNPKEPSASERIEWFSLGDLSVRSSLSLQYGLFTTFQDGAVAFSPQAGIVLKLPKHWKAETSVRQRLHQTTEQWVADFQPAHYGQRFECTTAEKSCYRLRLSRSQGNLGSFEVGALYRRFSDTLRVYFADNLFDDLDSLFFVDGDQLPELHIGFSRRLSQNIMAGFASNVAVGGGGTLAGGLENSVRYIVTSLNADFEGSKTGLVLSFHSLDQRLLDRSGAHAFDPIEKDRLQLLLTQGLARFLGFAPDVDLILDLQIRRSGQQLAEASSDYSRRILGGIALRF